MTNTEKLIAQNLVALQGKRSHLEMASIIGACSVNTWRKRLNEPGTLTVSELTKLAKAYKISIRDIVATDLIRRIANEIL